MISNIFHDIPKPVKKFFQPKGATKLTIRAYREKGEEKSDWYFNKFPITWREMLCFPEVLDELSEGKDRITMTVSINPSDGAERVVFEMDDPFYTEASIYRWKGQEIWLCPWLQWFFGHKPAELWFTVDK